MKERLFTLLQFFTAWKKGAFLGWVYFFEVVNNGNERSSVHNLGANSGFCHSFAPVGEIKKINIGEYSPESHRACLTGH
jgi:hypothetical protein